MFFRYGFGQTFLEGLTVGKGHIGASWRETFAELSAAFHRRILKDKADKEGIVENPPDVSAIPGEGDVSYATEAKETLIPYATKQDTYNYYTIKNYVNDINGAYTKPLSAYNEKNQTTETDTYDANQTQIQYNNGEKDYCFSYDGTGSVSELTDASGGGNGQKEATAVGALAQGVRSEEEHAAEKTIAREAVSEEEQTAARDGVKVGESGSKTGNVINNLDTNNIPNMTKQNILNEIPDNWKYTEHNGFVHIKDETGTMRIRIDPPDKVTLYSHVHVYDNNGNLFDVRGNIVDRKSPDGHITYKN